MSQSDEKQVPRRWETLICLARVGVLFAPAFVGLLALAILSAREPAKTVPHGIDPFMTGSTRR
ncbi:hypothetical protein [Aquamicrobium terrae]|uniref:Uncharacterized protein n=1 Tax=Aquamicrobium terrae TaxID=1324945 RepID=A0ABV2MXW5_9HYPH